MTLLELALKIAMSCGFMLGQSPTGEEGRPAWADANLGESDDAERDRAMEEFVAQFRDSSAGSLVSSEIVPLLDQMVDAGAEDEVEGVLDAFLNDGVLDRFVLEVLAFIQEHNDAPFLATITSVEAEGYNDFFGELGEMLPGFEEQVERARKLLIDVVENSAVQEVFDGSGGQYSVSGAVEQLQLHPLVELLYDEKIPWARRNGAMHAYRFAVCQWALGRMLHRGSVPGERVTQHIVDTWVSGLERAVAVLRTLQDPEELAVLEQGHERVLLAYAKLTAPSEDKGAW
jgi:hypothetical protein